MAQANKRIEDQNSLQADRSFEDQLRERLGLEERKRRRLERHRAIALRDGEDMPPMSSADLKALEAADRVEASAVKGKRGAPALRDKAARMRDQVGADRTTRAEARRADLRLAQTVELDAVREGVAPDQVVEARRGGGDKRLKTRDGLKMLHESGALTPKDGRAPMLARMEADRLLAVGLRYRERYEIAATSLKSCLATGGEPARPMTTYARAKMAHRRAAVANRVRVLDMAVAARLGPEAVLALRMIAGEARTVRGITESRRRRGRLAEALAQALDVVGDVIAKGH